MYNWERARERMSIDLLRWSPKATVTRGIGWIARRRVPRGLREAFYLRFARRAGIDLASIDRPLIEFESLDDFFTRPLPEGARPIAPGDDTVVSPCDGVLLETGVAGSGRLTQCKGRDYTVRGLLADEAEARTFLGGAYATIYLSPRHYHRVHAPSRGVIAGFRRIPGALFPVNLPAVRNVSGLYSINERLVTYLEGPLGRVALVMVAAIGVGHITVTYDRLEGHPRGGWGRRSAVHYYATPRRIAKGEELGTFHLGSTVVLLFEPGRVTLAGLERGQTLRLGEPLGQRLGGRSGEVAA